MAKKLLIDFVWIGSILFFAYTIAHEQKLWVAILFLFMESAVTEYLHYLTYDND